MNTRRRPHNRQKDFSFKQDLLDQFKTPTTYLTQHDFRTGTLRITKSGYYQLTENIAFEPQRSVDYKPTIHQQNIYPSPPYQLGFFAAITIETSDVILDLGSYTIEQTPHFALQQRFFSLIELADQPFLHKQGPSEFGKHTASAYNCIIRNGTLGRSSHHGIHGNNPHNVIIENLIIEKFEVAAVHLNGAHTCHLNNLHIRNNFKRIPVLGFYSHARFLRSFLRQAAIANPTKLWRGGKGDLLYRDLVQEMQRVEKSVLDGTPLPSSIFTNSTGKNDGSVYGIVINSIGVAINGFQLTYNDNTASHDVFISNVCIENLESEPQEVIAMSANTGNDDNEKAYASTRVVTGPVGDVIPFHALQKNGVYCGNVLSEAQCFVAKYGTDLFQRGRSNIPEDILKWAEKGTPYNTTKYYPIYHGDSMHHVNKGNIGIFISGSNAQLDNIQIKHIYNTGLASTFANDALMSKQVHGKKSLQEYCGHSVRGIACASSNVKMENVNVNELYATHGHVLGVDLIGDSTVKLNHSCIMNLQTNSQDQDNIPISIRDKSTCTHLNTIGGMIKNRRS